MKDGLGSIRTGIQGQGGGEVAGAGERSAGGGGARGWHWGGNPGAMARGCAVQAARGRAWTAGARLEAVITTAAMNEAGKSAWCREHGVYPAELDKWRASCTTALADPEDARASPQATRADRKRIKELERDLLRKDRALAETAALLVLSKKVAAIFNKGEDE
jgi:transposase